MKYLFTCLLLAGGIGLASAQQTKLLVEVGGAYGSSTIADKPMEGFTANQSLKTPKLHVQVGGFLSSRSVLGASYNLSKENQSTYNEQNSSNFLSESSSGNEMRSNAFGIFYRHYLKPFNSSRWNMFLELNPNYQTIKYTQYSVRNSWMIVDGRRQLINDSNSSAEMEEKAIDVDLRAGGSYRIAKNFHIQLSLLSIANLHRKFEITDGSNEDSKQTNINILQSPLSNAYLSLLFTL